MLQALQCSGQSPMYKRYSAPNANSIPLEKCHQMVSSGLSGSGCLLVNYTYSFELALLYCSILNVNFIFYFYLWTIFFQIERGQEKETEGERERERERDISLLSHIFMYSLVDSYMCPDQGSNLQPWRIWTMFQPTELPSQGLKCQF